MEAKKQLRKPENWQDFESLCKKLWGEIWECPEIKKNGRLGQEQRGVDVYGIPKGENRYYGVQCKGKDEYTHKKLTEDQIIGEIKEAKGFKPPLKKLYIAATANKDSTIEEFVRKKDLEHRARGLFEVHLFLWEDIVDLIDENKGTHDWYVQSVNYKTYQEALVTFGDGSNELIIMVPFVKRIVHYKLKEEDTGLVGLADLIRPVLVKPVVYANPFVEKFNESVCRFRFCVKNIGTLPIEHMKLFFEFIGDYEEVGMYSKFNNGTMKVPFYTNTYIVESNKVEFNPAMTVLVQDDSVCTDEIYLKPKHHPTDIKISWKLVSKDFKMEGELSLRVEPTFRLDETTIMVRSESEVRTVETIEDILE